MEAPSWRRRGTNNGYHKSVVEVVVAGVAETMVARCVTAVTVPAEVEEAEEREEEEERQTKSDDDQRC